MEHLSGRHFLQIPGPTNVPDRILRAMAAPTIDHRGPEFAELARHVLAGLGRIAATGRPARAAGLAWKNAFSCEPSFSVPARRTYR